MNEIRDGIWGGATVKRSLVELYSSNIGDDPNDVNNNLQRGSHQITLINGSVVKESVRLIIAYRICYGIGANTEWNSYTKIGIVRSYTVKLFNNIEEIMPQNSTLNIGPTSANIEFAGGNICYVNFSCSFALLCVL